MAPEAFIKKKQREGEQEIILQLLENVAGDDHVSQSEFATRVGIAKGLANSYFNRCLQKGWIKLKHAPRQRYLYYLTPKGLTEKARLTVQFLSHSYQFYREARADLLAAMNEAQRNGHRRLAVLGDGELAEIAAIISSDALVEIVGFLGSNGRREQIGGIPVVKEWETLRDAEAAVLATVDDARAHCQAVRGYGVTVYVPKQLSSLVW